jgi:hypothetical protein
LETLLRVMHDAEGEKGKEVMGVDELWRLGAMKGVLGLEERWVEWLRRCMGGFVRGLRGVPGWMDGGCWVSTSTSTGEELEKAVGVCLMFGWEEEFRAVAGRLAYVCRVEEDGALVKPDGKRVEMGVCGKTAVGEYHSCRLRLMLKMGC